MRGDAAWRACGHAPGHPAMPNACLPASLGENNLLFQKTLIFWEITQNLWARHAAPQGMLPRPRHAAKAMEACCQGQGSRHGTHHAARSQGMQPPKACCQGHGTHPRPWHTAPQGTLHAAKAMQQRRPRQQPPMEAMARSQGQGMQPPKARSQGQGMQPPQGMLPGPRHAAKAMARSQGHAAAKGKAAAPHGTRPRRWHAAKAMACCQGQGDGTQPRRWHAAKPKACCQGQGTQPRPRHAAKAKARHAAKAMACSQGQGMLSRPRQPPMGMLPRQRHAAKAKAKAACQGQGARSEGTRAASLRRARGKELIFFEGGLGEERGEGRIEATQG